MTLRTVIKNADGFTLVQVIFILVVLSLLGGAMVRLIGVQSSTSLFALQGARAYQAARSGLEWGAARARVGGNCTGSMTIEGFTVTTSCTSSVPPFEEGTAITTVFQIQATAVPLNTNYGTPGYVSRTLELKVAL